MKSFLTAILSIYLLTAGTTAKDAISVYPRIGRAPQVFRITTTVESPETATQVCVIADGAIYRVSCWEGAQIVRTTQIEWRDFPGGYYEFGLEITRKDGKTTLFRDRACVQGAISDQDGGCEDSAGLLD